MVHWKLPLCERANSLCGHWMQLLNKHGELLYLLIFLNHKLKKNFCYDSINFYLERTRLWVLNVCCGGSTLLCTAARQEECPCGPPAWISLCNVSYCLFLHTAPLTCSTVGCNPRGPILTQSWEWNFTSPINTQAFRSQIINSGCSETDNWDVRHFLNVSLCTCESEHSRYVWFILHQFMNCKTTKCVVCTS